MEVQLEDGSWVKFKNLTEEDKKSFLEKFNEAKREGKLEFLGFGDNNG